MTAAIRDASTCLSAACWRMMSSWRSGSLISLTAWSAGLTRLSTATITSARPAPSVNRRRSTAAREGRRLLALLRGAVTGWALMLLRRQLLKNPRQLLLEFAQTAGVLYSVRGPVGLLGLCQLSCRAFVQGLVPARPSALGAHRLIGHDGDRGVVVALQARLEEQ